MLEKLAELKLLARLSVPSAFLTTQFQRLEMCQASKLSCLRSNSAESQVSKFIPLYLANLDIYITMVSHSHAVCSKDLYIAIISATVETANPQAELEPAIKMLGSVREMFCQVSELFEPTNNWA
jgi:RAB protein geranylgeranyltransferase component A